MDNYKRKIFLKNESKKILLKSIKKNKNVTYTKRHLSSFYISNLVRFSGQNYNVNRCVVSGRAWSVNRKTFTSRFVFRNKAYASLIPGCKRASW